MKARIRNARRWIVALAAAVVGIAGLGQAGSGTPDAHAGLCLILCSPAPSPSPAPVSSPTGPACTQIGTTDLNPTNTPQAPTLGVPLVPRRPDGAIPWGFTALQSTVDAGIGRSRELALNRLTGTDVTKITVTWGAIERTRGVRHWNAYDALYCTLLANGQRPLLTILGAPGWAVNNSSVCSFTLISCFVPPSNGNLPALRDFIEQLAIRYPSAVGIEAWNEPNVNLYWRRPDPARYVGVLQAIYQGAKNGNPSIPVLGGSLSSHQVTLSDGTMASMDFLQDIYADGAGGWMDGLSMHPYPAVLPSPTPNRFRDLIEQARSIAASYDGPGQRHIWLTEVGVPAKTSPTSWGATEQDQAAWLMDTNDYANASSDIDVELFHSMVDALNEHRYGFVKRPDSQGRYYGRLVYCAFANRFAGRSLNCAAQLPV